MRDRNLAPAPLVGATVCCGVMALIAGPVGGVALVSIGRFTAVSVAGVGVVVAIAWWLDRRRHPHDRTHELDDRTAHARGTLR